MSLKTQTRVHTIFFVPVSSRVFLSEGKHVLETCAVKLKEKEVTSLKRQTRVNTNFFVPVIRRFFLSDRNSQLDNIFRIVKAEFC